MVKNHGISPAFAIFINHQSTLLTNISIINTHNHDSEIIISAAILDNGSTLLTIITVIVSTINTYNEPIMVNNGR